MKKRAWIHLERLENMAKREAKIREEAFSEKEPYTEYDGKPLACSSPLVLNLNGQPHRVHMGGDFSSGRLEPSVWKIATYDEAVIPRLKPKYLFSKVRI